MEKLEEEIRQAIENESTENLEKNHRLFKRYLVFFAVLIFLIGSFFVGYRRGQKNSAVVEKNVSLNEAFIDNKLPSPDKTIDFSLFWKVWDLLKEKHIKKDSLDAQQLVYGAISGMIRAIDDPYTDFFDPEQSKSFASDIEGSFEGIGAELGIKDNILTIIAPLDGSPAQKAGLRSGDKILKVDDKVVADLTIDQAVSIIRGEKDTQVTLTILRAGEQETREITITRDNIEIKNIKLEFKDDDIVHIKIIKFSDNVGSEFNAAIKTIVEKESRGIILDLRDNPGGLLDKSVDVASRLIPKGKAVVLEEDNAGHREILYTSGGDKLSLIPTVVLINEGSASASEILAGALKDNRDLTLIGKKTFGKGSVQQLVDLPGGSSVKITVARWLTPNGNYIMDIGINPDIEVDLTLDDYNNNRDPQLDRAMEVLKEKMK